MLDPTCGEAVFLLAAARRLADNGADPSRTGDRLHGVDLHDASLERCRGILKMEPSEAAALPVPSPAVLEKAWPSIEQRQAFLDELFGRGSVAGGPRGG